MRPEQQYIDLYAQAEALLRNHSAEPLNRLRARAFADFERQGFPTRKEEAYKYTDVAKCFEPDYGMNFKRLAFPVNPYEVFKCDVPNMSTASVQVRRAQHEHRSLFHGERYLLFSYELRATGYG